MLLKSVALDQGNFKFGVSIIRTLHLHTSQTGENGPEGVEMSSITEKYTFVIIVYN
jgi:hypothetical protein